MQANVRHTTSDLVISCPQCSLSMNVGAIASRSTIKCPRCSHSLNVDPGKANVNSVEANSGELEMLPEPIVIQDQVAKPATSKRALGRAIRRAHRDANIDTIRARRRVWWTRSAIVVLGLVVVGTAGVGAKRWFQEVPQESWMGYVPGIDAPEKLLADYARITSTCVATCDSVTDVRSGEQVAAKFNLLAGQLRAIPTRVDQLGPLSEANLRMIDPAFADRVSQSLDESESSVREIMSDKRKYSQELFRSLMGFTEANKAASVAILGAWAPESKPASQRPEAVE